MSQTADRTQHRTTIGRATAALVAGAVTGAGMFLAPMAISLTQTDPASRVPIEQRWQVVELFLAIYAFVFVYIAIGLVAVGVPFWWLLHRRGIKSWFHALALGAVLSLVSYACLVTLSLVPSLIGPGQLYLTRGQQVSGADIAIVAGLNAAWITVCGAISGLIIWGIAYRTSAGQTSSVRP